MIILMPSHFSKTALVETLEADVRSKFQTKRRIEDAAKGQVVEVPFDEAVVRFFWIESRTLEIQDVVYRSEAITELEKLEVENQLLNAVDEGVDPALVTIESGRGAEAVNDL